MIAPDHTQVARLVVRAPNWLGDAVMALPAMAAVRRHFSTAHLTIAAPKSVAALFHEQTDVRPDAVLVLPSDTHAATRVVRDGAFELGILFPNSFGSAWMLKRAGVPQRWGIARDVRGWLLTRKSARRTSALRTSALPHSAPSHSALHHTEFYRNLIRGLGIPCDDEAPVVTASAPSRAAAEMLLTRAGVSPGTRLVGVAPGAAYGQAKQWPPERMAGVMARLIRERDVTCVVVGAAHDRVASREIESWLRTHAPETLPRMVDLVGRTDLGSLVGVVSMCRVFVSNDSGAMHVAAATGRPVVAMFGPTDERATRPVGRGDVLTADVFCRPCHLRDCPIDHRCMKRITIDAVFAGVSRHLAFSRAEVAP
jgi:heptosyltransferase-2